MSDLEKVEKLAESYGYKGVDTSKVSSYGGSPTPKHAADAFAMVEIQDMSVEKLVVSPTIFSQMKDSSDWSDVFQGFDSDENKVDMWGAYIESDEEVPDNLMLALPQKDYKDTALLGASVWDPNAEDDKGTDNDNDEEDPVPASKSESDSEMADLLMDMMSNDQTMDMILDPNFSRTLIVAGSKWPHLRKEIKAILAQIDIEKNLQDN